MKPVTIIALIISGIALILAIAPPIIIEKKVSSLEETKVEHKKRFSLKIKKFEIRFFGKEKPEGLSEKELKIAKLKATEEMFIIASLVVGSIALLLGIFSLIKKESMKFSFSSIGIASVAMVWHYIAPGITIGVAIFIVIVLLMNLGF